MVNYNLPLYTGFNSVLQRIEEIEKISKLIIKNSYASVVNGVSSDIAKQRFSSMVEMVAKEHNVDPKLIRAVIEQESRFNPNAISASGAIGLMQLMPGTARDMGVKDPLNPLENIRGGTKYLSSLLNRYQGNVVLALSAYNAGPTNVNRFGGLPPFRETRNYVKEIVRKLS